MIWRWCKWVCMLAQQTARARCSLPTPLWRWYTADHVRAPLRHRIVRAYMASPGNRIFPSVTRRTARLAFAAALAVIGLWVARNFLIPLGGVGERSRRSILAALPALYRTWPLQFRVVAGAAGLHAAHWSRSADPARLRRRRGRTRRSRGLRMGSPFAGGRHSQAGLAGADTPHRQPGGAMVAGAPRAASAGR